MIICIETQHNSLNSFSNYRQEADQRNAEIVDFVLGKIGHKHSSFVYFYKLESDDEKKVKKQKNINLEDKIKIKYYTYKTSFEINKNNFKEVLLKLEEYKNSVLEEQKNGKNEIEGIEIDFLLKVLDCVKLSFEAHYCDTVQSLNGSLTNVVIWFLIVFVMLFVLLVTTLDNVPNKVAIPILMCFVLSFLVCMCCLIIFSDISCSFFTNYVSLGDTDYFNEAIDSLFKKVLIFILVSVLSLLVLSFVIIRNFNIHYKLELEEINKRYEQQGNFTGDHPFRLKSREDMKSGSIKKLNRYKILIYLFVFINLSGILPLLSIMLSVTDLPKSKFGEFANAFQSTFSGGFSNLNEAQKDFDN